MAGDWVKMRVALAYDLKVTRIARTINRSSFLSALAPEEQLSDGACNVPTLQLLVVGALHKFWCAAQEITVDGVLRNCDPHDVDQMVGVIGFADALIEVGWLTIDAHGGNLLISNFQEHNGEGAKKRAQANKRVAKHRDEKRESVTSVKRESVTREEKRREEKKTDAFALPSWVPEENWKAWLEVRSKNRAPNTPRALLLAVKELDRLRGLGQDPATLLDKATLNGWRAIWPLKDQPAAVTVDL